MVSVIIPAYNYAQFLPEALESVRAQSLADVECIVIDNGSTDNTREIMSPFLRDPRFSYVRQDKQTVSAARNAGIKASKGEFIMFLDADDKMQPEKLSESVEFLMSHPEVDLVYTDMRYFRNDQPDRLYHSFACDDASDRPWMSYLSGSGKNVVATFLQGNTIVISSPVVRRSVLDKTGYFDAKLSYNEDWDLWLRMALSGAHIHYLDKPGTLALIRIHNSSASRDVFRMQVCGLYVLMKNGAALKSAGLNRPWALRVSEHKRAITSSLLRAGSDGNFASRIAYLKEMDLYKEVVGIEAGNSLLLRLYLRLGQLLQVAR
jgi:glycosyltransferase involved in cell wall biosynthesis